MNLFKLRYSDNSKNVLGVSAKLASFDFVYLLFL